MHVGKPWRRGNKSHEINEGNTIVRVLYIELKAHVKVLAVHLIYTKYLSDTEGN